MVIGIFDSGRGGVSVLKGLSRSLKKNVRFIYRDDPEYFPYGNKSPELITQRAIYNVERLKQQKAEMVVVACHTASCVAADKIREYFGGSIKMFDMVQATRRLIKPELFPLSFLATEATIRSNCYQRLYGSQDVIFQPVGALVKAIERSASPEEILDQLRQLINENSPDKPRSIVLACTHLSLPEVHIEQMIRRILNQKIRVIDPVKGVVNDVVAVLASHY